MSNTAKWILGIALGLIIVCAVALVSSLAVSQWMGDSGVFGIRTGRLWGEEYLLPHDDNPMHSYGKFPGQRVYSNFPLWVIGLPIFCLGFLLLIGLGVLAVVLLTRRRSQTSASPAPPPTIPSQPEQVVIPGTIQTCSNCEKEVQDDWNLCPYCGNELSSSS